MPDQEYTPTPLNPTKENSVPQQLTLNNETLTISEWAKRAGISPQALRRRIKMGWDAERCVMAPKQKYVQHELSGSRAATAWESMMRRCFDPKCPAFTHYTQRGITVCEGWQNLKQFVSNMGECPTGLTLDRTNNNGGYWCGKCAQCLSNGWPMNCRWETPEVQANNTSQNVLLTLNGVTQGVKAWALELDLVPNTIYGRKIQGWSDERILTTPRRKPKTAITL